MLPLNKRDKVRFSIDYSIQSSVDSPDDLIDTPVELFGTLRINVGGTKFVFRRSTIWNRPKTRLYKLLKQLLDWENNDQPVNVRRVGRSHFYKNLLQAVVEIQF